MARKRIYISSTYADLTEYREIAAGVIEECGHVVVDSYKAGSKPTVAQCLADVASCDVLVCIVGLRYGWVPEDGDPRSITHREFDQAAKLERLVLMMSDRIADLAEAVRKFRAAIPSAVLPAEFSNQRDFDRLLRKSLQERIGTVEKVPRLLPYFCDRTEQYEKIDDRLAERRQQTDMRLRIFLAHADEKQGGREFIQVLHHKLREFPATRDAGEPVEFEIEWPKPFENPSAFRRRLQRAVAEGVMQDRQAVLEKIEQQFAAIPGPILVHTYLSTSEYEQTGETAIAEFCRFWEEWAALRRMNALIVVLRIEYELPKPGLLGMFGWSRGDRRNDTIREFLTRRFAGNAEICQVLPELPRIPVGDAIKWSHKPEVQAVCGSVGVDPQIREIYRNKFAREPEEKARMYPLADELEQLLKGAS